jgi:DNA polymerase/3'-5' exonuclease PolX
MGKERRDYPMELSFAEQWAARQIAEWQPFCERVAVAGSVRRGKGEVKDIEFVAIPRRDGGRNLLHAHILEKDVCSTFYPIKPGSPDVETRWRDPDPDGKYWRFRCVQYLWGRDEPLRFNVDIFLVSRESWGLQLLIRTGSGAYEGDARRGFSPGMLARWKRVAGIPRDRKGSVGGQLVDKNGVPIATPEEEDVFRLCKVKFIPPHLRESGGIIRLYEE